MAKQRRRGPKHPGVVIIKPNPERRIGWRVRYTDPDTGRPKHESLDVSLTTQEQRDAWAAWKSRQLAKRRMELEGGAPRATGAELAGEEGVIERYFKAHPQLRDRTRGVYRDATNKLSKWAAAHGVTSADHLTRAKLLAFRETLIREPKHVTVRGKRGGKGKTTEPRSAHTVNRELRATRTVLGYLCDLDLFPKLSHDDLRRALKRLPTTLEVAEYLRPHELQKLLEASMRHDAEVFAENREEHAGERPKGTTARYDPITPLVATVLLTGMRFGEAVHLEWSQVDLDALGHDGHRAGEIRLKGSGAKGTKTGQGRLIDLSVSPALRKLLASMHLASGGKGRVFPITRATAEAARKRLVGEVPKKARKADPKRKRKVEVITDFGAPKAFTWQLLRSTCATYLTNAPGIFGAASAYRSAKQLGHSVTVAEKHYTDVLKGIPREASTLEDAMGIGEVVGKIGPGQPSEAKPRSVGVLRTRRHVELDPWPRGDASRSAQGDGVRHG